MKRMPLMCLALTMALTAASQVTGYQLSSMTVDADGSVLMRLFNADGDGRPHDIPLNLPITSVTEVDLKGNELSHPPYSNHRLTVQMPRFGIRTYRLILSLNAY